MDHALGDDNSNHIQYECEVVLILVLVDHALGEFEARKADKATGLNPCFSGPCSRSIKFMTI